jgi:tyrosine-specific transport protein
MGGSLLISGTALGAGMLAIPMVLAQFGLLWGSLLMLLIWIGTSYAALLLLEATIKSGGGIGMNSIARKTLGKEGQLITNVLLYCLVICLMIAYIVSAADLLQKVLQSCSIDLGLVDCQVIFTFVAGFFVAQGTASIDKLNRILFFIMLLVLTVSLLYLLPNISFAHLNLFDSENKIELFRNSSVLFTSFGFMVVIPSVVKYNSGATHKQLRNMVLIGAAIPLLCYLLWLFAVVGNLPAEQLVKFANVSELISVLSLRHSYLGPILSLFTGLALLTSFLGVAMSLFDQNSDLFNKNKMMTFVLTFLLPLVGALWAKEQFISVLGYAGMILVFLAVFVPMAMVLKVRTVAFSSLLEGVHYQVAGGRLALLASFAFGGLLLLSQLF